MTIKELKSELDKYPDDAQAVIEYTHYCDGQCNPHGRCYCPSEEREAEILHVCPKEAKTHANPSPAVKTVLINVDIDWY